MKPYLNTVYTINSSTIKETGNKRSIEIQRHEIDKISKNFFGIIVKIGKKMIFISRFVNKYQDIAEELYV